jgi:hypothetical protein
MNRDVPLKINMNMFVNKYHFCLFSESVDKKEKKIFNSTPKWLQGLDLVTLILFKSRAFLSMVQVVLFSFGQPT